jgi:cholesterol transport system auxiliary component
MMQAKLTNLLHVGVLGLALAGCGSAPQSFDLSPAANAPRAGAIRGQLAIAPPKADENLDSQQVLVRRVDSSLATLAGAQWSARLPDLVQTRLMQSFEHAGLAGSVVPYGSVAAYQISTEINLFELDVGAGLAQVEIVARIFNSNGKVLASRTFKASAPAPTTANGAGPRALDAALKDCLSQIVAWSSARL